MNGQNDRCLADEVPVGTPARGRWMLPIQRTFMLAVAIGATLAPADNVSAMEDVATGRWITRDPHYLNEAISLPGNPVALTTPEIWLNPAMLAGVQRSAGEEAMLLVFLASSPTKLLDASGEQPHINCSAAQLAQLRFYELSGAWKLRAKSDQAGFLAKFSSGIWCKRALTTFERISRSTSGELCTANYPYTCRSHAPAEDYPAPDYCAFTRAFAWTEGYLPGKRVHLCDPFYDQLWWLPWVQEGVVAHEASHHFGTNDKLWPLDPWTAHTYQAVVTFYPIFFPVFAGCLPGHIEPPSGGLQELVHVPITIPGM